MAALYRKYRPQNFDNLVDQEHVKTTLKNALQTDHIAHAYLFSGPRGTGKTSTARLLAKALNCTDLKDKFEPCEKCDFCKDITDGRLIDLIEIDAASNRGIDEVRDLNEKIRFAPTHAKCKVYIVDEVHMMTKEAFNALLKTLEEPPEHAYFILATTEVHKIPDTIISRCQRFDFKRITSPSIVARLKHIAKAEKVDAEESALEAIAKYADGGMRDAVGLFEQLVVGKDLKFEHVKEVLGISDHAMIENLYKALVESNAAAGISVVHNLHDQGNDLVQFTHEFVNSLREKLLNAVENGQNCEPLLNMISIFQRAQREIGGTSIPQLPLEMAVVRVAGKVEKSEPKPAPKAAPKVEVAAVSEPEPVTEPVIEPVTESAPEPEPEPAKTATGGDISIEMLKEKWPRVTERVKIPSLRMSLKSAQVEQVDGSDVVLKFGTNFHKNKVMEHDNRVALESLIGELTGQSVKISGVVKELEIMPVVEEKVTVPSFAPESEPEPKKDEETVEAALDIFGGEVVG